jgi:lipopolysaccharide/colanic/teichoic acid biosynthesis glycosyltransferase
VILKRAFDFILALIGLIVLAPFMLAIAVTIKWKMSGPVFFRQQRIGQYGDVFTLVKFRTMNINSSGGTVTVEGDTRITPIGAFLRRHKLDELPELWNVLKGEMSFVGPRPDVPGYADQLKGADREMLLLKPGITSPASLKYKNEEQLLSQHENPIHYNDNVLFPDKVRINLLYQKERTMWMDVEIIVYTVFGVQPKDSWIH